MVDGYVFQLVAAEHSAKKQSRHVPGLKPVPRIRFAARALTATDNLSPYNAFGKCSSCPGISFYRRIPKNGSSGSIFRKCRTAARGLCMVSTEFR
jgi:hypothetical protein